ncbi:hypothetical protein D3C87_1325520 [compost metagenome]
MQSRNHNGRILQRPHPVNLHIGNHVVFSRRVDHATPRTTATSEPVTELFGIADSSGEPQSLKLPSRQHTDSLKDGQQVPTAIIPSESMHFINDHRSHIGKQLLMINLAGN